MYKKHILVLISSLFVSACSTNESINLTSSETITSLSNTSKNIKFLPETEFSKFAKTKSKNSYLVDQSFEKTKLNKNGIFDFLSKDFPYKSYFELENFIKSDLDLQSFDMYAPRNDYFDTRYAKKLFDENVTSYSELQKKFNASKSDMKRFLIVETMANSYYSKQPLDEKQVHVPEFKSGYKLNPIEATNKMYTFLELDKEDKPTYWNTTKATKFYKDNYSRYIGLIMEKNPSRKDLLSTMMNEISEFAWNPG